MQNYSAKLDKILRDEISDGSVSEGSMVCVNKMISDAIGVPPGNYIVWAIEFDTCNLIPTSEDSKQQDFVVQRKTLEGFYSPEIHRRIEHTSGPTLTE